MGTREFIENCVQDVGYSLRLLYKSGGFTIIAVLTLTLGIGASSSILTVLNAALLRPLPYKAPDRLVWLNETLPDDPDPNVAWLDLQDWKRQNTVFASIAGYATNTLTLTGRGSPKLLTGHFVGADYFSVMGVPAALGRTFSPEENLSGGSPVVILSHRLWQQDFGEDPKSLGTTVNLNAKSCTIVGVMPASFGDITHTDLWVPLEQYLPTVYTTNRKLSWFMYVVARLRPEVSFGEASSAMNVIAKSLAQQYPESNATTGVLMLPLARHISGDSRPMLLIVGAAVILLLLIACGNVAGLQLVRAVGREREISIKLALGAGRGRIFRQFMAESLILSFAGGIGGLLLTIAATKLIATVLPRNIALSGEITVDGTVLGITLLIILLASFIVGLAPAIRGMRFDLQSALRERSRQLSRSHRHMYQALIVCEMGLGMALLMDAGLIVRSMVSLLRVNQGFDAHQLLTETALLPDAQFPEGAQISSFFNAALARISNLPGVQSAAAIFPFPLSHHLFRGSVAIEGQLPRSGELRMTYFTVATPRSFRTMEIPVLRGREFVVEDTALAPAVAIVDQEFANRYFPNQDPVGKRIKLFTDDFGDPKKKQITIVGMVGNVKTGGLDSDLGGQIYVPSDQLPNLAMTFVVRTAVAPLSLAKPVEVAIHAIRSDIPVYAARTAEDVVRESLTVRRIAMLLLSSLAIVALLLSALGLYGAMSYIVGQRVNEIGIRMALGAKPFEDVMRSVLAQAAKLALIGVAIGFTASIALTQLMTSLLYGVQWRDPLTCTLVAILLVTVAVSASYVPARRAMRVDPIVALRYE